MAAMRWDCCIPVSKFTFSDNNEISTLIFGALSSCREANSLSQKRKRRRRRMYTVGEKLQKHTTMHEQTSRREELDWDRTGTEVLSTCTWVL